MARLVGGILGSVAGKVAGVVAARWKDRAYVRGYVVPAYTNTIPQQEKRLRFKLAALFGMSILGIVLQPYMDKFMRGMSAFNWFVKTNIALFVGTIDYSMVQVTHGPLYAATITQVTNVLGAVSVTFSSGLGSNGLSTDLVYAVVYHIQSGRATGAIAEVTRNVGTIEVDIIPLTGDLGVYLITIRRDEDTNAVTIVSDSVADLWTMT